MYITRPLVKESRLLTTVYRGLQTIFSSFTILEAQVVSRIEHKLRIVQNSLF